MKRHVSLSFALLLIHGLCALHADTITWTGATNSLWSENGNWDTGTIPGNGDLILFHDVANQVVDLQGDTRTAGSAEFNAPDGYTFNGTGRIELQNNAGSGWLMDGAGDVEVNTDFRIVGFAFIGGRGTGDLRLNGRLVTASNRSLYKYGNFDLNLTSTNGVGGTFEGGNVEVFEGGAGPFG